MSELDNLIVQSYRSLSTGHSILYNTSGNITKLFHDLANYCRNSVNERDKLKNKSNIHFNYFEIYSNAQIKTVYFLN